MLPPGIEARAATKADLGALTTSLARAFADDPVTNYLMGTDQRRLRSFFAAQLRVRLRIGEILTTDVAEAVALWAPPGRWETGWIDVLRLAPAMNAALRTRLPRGLRVLSLMERAHPHEPHWYLALLGTDPAAQGKGLGTAVVQPILDRCDEAGLGAYLESSKERNIPYYERFGFVVTGEIVFPDGPSMWPMWREPRT